MQIEMYQQTKPAAPWRSLIVSGLLLLGATALAARMSGTRGPEPLGSRVDLHDFRCSLRIPAGFVPSGQFAVDEWLIQTFDGSRSTWASAELGVWSSRGGSLGDLDSTALDILRRILNARPQQALEPAISKRLGVRIGDYQAVEILDQTSGIAVRLHAAAGGTVLAVTFAADAPTRTWYPTFSDVCKSVRVAPESEAP